MPGTDLGGRGAIVTGGSRGIGQAIARSLVECGAQVVVTSRHLEAAESSAAEIGAGAVGFEANSVDEEAAQACVDFALERFGRLDILINNAGTNAAFGPLVEVEHDRFTKTYDLNVWAPVLWSGIAWGATMAEAGGAIVNVASIGASAVVPNLGVYHSSKAAIVHLTRHMAMEMAPKVRVNAVSPGVVRTHLAEKLWKEHEAEVAAATPGGRIGEPEDIGPVAAFLASDAAGWITGETVTVDGGQVLGNPVI
ncbi:MAG TPA: SDR family oxidoreductase [Solirubrobacterales bacterium]